MFNTSKFYFSDFKYYLLGVDELFKGNELHLFKQNYSFAISYIGYIFVFLFNNIQYYFIFNSIIGCFTYFLVFNIYYKLFGKKNILIFYIAFFYIEYLSFSSIYYSNILMICILLTLILLIFESIKFNISSKIFTFYFTLIILIFTISLFIKAELLYLPYFLIPLLIFDLFKNISKMKYFLIILTLTIISLSFTFYIYDKLNNETEANDFIFYGHTIYGNGRGEGDFVKNEYKELYKLKLKKYKIENNIDSLSRKDINEFQNSEIITFITKSPFEWIFLQCKKLLYEYGVFPEGNTFIILYSGLFKSNFYLTIFTIVIPYIFIIISFVLSFRINIYSELLKSNKFIFAFLSIIFLYYLIATVFYGQYQERYRFTIMILFIIPLTAYQIQSIINRELQLSEFFNIKKLKWNYLVLCFLFIFWIYQTYEALIIDKERYSIINKNPNEWIK